MSELEEGSHRNSATMTTLVVVGIFLAIGCLVVCVGLVGVGLIVPQIHHQRMEAKRAETEARKAAQSAEEKARAAHAAAAKAAERPAKETAAEPAAEPPAKDNSQGEDEET